MDTLAQIEFWGTEVKRTTDEAGRLFKNEEFQKSREILQQSTTAMARLRKEVEASELYHNPKYGPKMDKDLKHAETQLQALIKLTQL